MKFYERHGESEYPQSTMTNSYDRELYLSPFLNIITSECELDGRILLKDTIFALRIETVNSYRSPGGLIL